MMMISRYMPLFGGGRWLRHGRMDDRRIISRGQPSMTSPARHDKGTQAARRDARCHAARYADKPDANTMNFTRTGLFTFIFYAKCTHFASCPPLMSPRIGRDIFRWPGRYAERRRADAAISGRASISDTSSVVYPHRHFIKRAASACQDRHDTRDAAQISRHADASALRPTTLFALIDV